MNCGAYAHFKWFKALGFPDEVYLDTDTLANYSDQIILGKFYFSKCSKCKRLNIWDSHKSTMIYPEVNLVSPPNGDMPLEIQSIYIKASRIVTIAPEASAALLRKALELLCYHLQAKGKNLAAKIGHIYQELAGQDPIIGQCMDIIRNYGNDSIHPEQTINMDDAERKDSILFMFEILNDLVDEFITKPDKIKKHFERIPPSDRLKALNQ